MELVDDLPLVRSGRVQLQKVIMSPILNGVIDGPKESADEMERGEAERLRVLAEDGGFDSATVEGFVRSFEAIAKSNKDERATVLTRVPFEPKGVGSSGNP